MAKLRHKKHKEISKAAAKKALDTKRNKIDLIDSKLIYLLMQRIKVAKEIAGLKKKLRVDVLQKKRIAVVLKKRKAIAKKYGISQILIEKLYKEIIKECMRIERKMIA